MKTLLLLAGCLSLISCAPDGITISRSAKPNTIAQGVLQTDVLAVLGPMVASQNKNCAKPVVTHVETNQSMKTLPNGDVKASEFWLVDRCGEDDTYEIFYTQEPGQGTHFTIERF